MRRGQRLFEVIVGIAVLTAPALVAIDHFVERLDRRHVDIFRPPIGRVVRLPRIMPAAREAVGGEAHDLERAIAGQHHQVRPGQCGPVLLLDRPDQPARLVGVAIVPPAVDRGEALHRLARAAAPVGDAIGAGRMPGHADHLRAVIAVIGRPPGDRAGQERLDLRLQRLKVDRLECRLIVEILAQRIGARPVAMQLLDAKAIGIPILQRRLAGLRSANPITTERALPGQDVLIVFHEHALQHPPLGETGAQPGDARDPACDRSSLIHIKPKRGSRRAVA